MATKRKQDDKHLKILRELGTKPDNKKCFDCEQRGPTYVNMTVGSFVCTRCSGILRGLNPPHRVKSISMTSFSTQEIEFLEKHGNEFCRQTWLGLENSRGSSLESKDEQKVRDYMVQKYERKKWYVPPSQVKLNNSSNSTPEAQPPLRQVASSISPKTTLSTSSSSPPSTKVAAKISLPMPGAVPGPALQATVRSTPSAPIQQQPSMDLLGDLGGDPFSQPQQQKQQQQQQQQQTAAASAASGGFANFGQAFSGQAAQGNKPAAFDPFGAPAAFPTSSSFNAFGQAAPQASSNVNASSVSSSTSFNAFGAAPAPAQPASSGFAAFSAAPTLTPAAAGSNAAVGQTAQSLFNLSLTTSAPSSAASQPVNSSDKYAIFSSFGTDGASASASTGTKSIDWSGGGGSSSGGTIDWSGGGGSSSSGGTIDWSGGSKGGGASLLSGTGIDWGPGSNTNIKQPTTSGLMSSGPNPFSGQSSISSGMHGLTNTQPVYTGSMGGFGSQPAPQTSGFGAFGATQVIPGAQGTTGNMMNGGFAQPQGAGFHAQGGGFHAQGGFGGMQPMPAGAAQGQMGAGQGQMAGMGAGFGMQPQAGFPAGSGAMGGGMKAGFGAPTQPVAGQGFNQPGFGGAMQGGFGAPAQPGMNAMQPMGMGQPAGGGFQAHGTVGAPQSATGSMGFGAQQQGMPTGAGGWGQQQHNPFMGQADGFGQQPQAQRSTNPFM
ncbi:arf-GAP domain and FG repeat-containing protein 1-like [Patiria miniata]|uniref:Arf-GAP domain-containing protein n=1 Tax=Patiria miniata TaxID=46514 RepID=A0A913ZGU5_PATMI|nr:arf-GAP domain and FG repeat-containing protein 1-like [Patiria miniata]